MEPQQPPFGGPRRGRRWAALAGRLRAEARLALPRVYGLAMSQLTRLLLIPVARTVTIAVAVFVIDCLTPLGIATGVLYVAAVLSAVPMRHSKGIYYTAAVCSLLVLVGWFTSPAAGQTEWWTVALNRLLDLGVIWAAAGMAASWNRLQQRRLKQLQESQLLHQATTLSTSQLSFRKALQSSLTTLCDILGWPVGHVYLRDSEDRYLAASDLWVISQGQEFGLLQAAARGLRFARGEGVPGRVWQEGKPLAVADVTGSADYAWLKNPGLLGIRGAFALPITVDGKVAAVMEFFSEQPLAVDFEFMPLAENIGEQLGRLFERRLADQRLRQSEERLRLALEGGRMGIWEWHIETGRVLWSPELERMHGLEPGTFAGTLEAVLREIHPEDRERISHAIQGAVTRGGRDYRVEYRMIHPDGSVRWLEGRGTAHDDEEGLPQRMVGVCMDITERKTLQERNARLAAIVQSSDDAILAKSLDGTILSWNGGAERIYGYTADEIIGKPASVLVPEDMPDETADSMQRISRGEHIHHYETLRRRKDGRVIAISLSLSPIVDSEGHVLGASSIARDVTEKKQAEQEMKEARERAETANRLRSRFLANISHELRTPMNSILGMLQLALASEMTAEVHGWLTTAKTSADSLLVLLNDLLDFSKIEANKLDIQPAPFCLSELLDETVRSLASNAFDKGIELLVDLDGDVPDRLTGDASRLRQILTNLIVNAVKFTEQGEVVVKAGLDTLEQDAAVVRFTVSDTGAGIASADQQRIFEPFIQSDATAARRQGGAGLGLSIAKELVRRMGGELRVESEPGEGSRFWFSLPLRVEAGSVDEGMTPNDMGLLEGVPVLIVSHHAATRDLLMNWLSQWSMLSEAAIDGDHALGKLYRAQAEHRSIRLVIADAAMPDLEGQALVERIAGAVAEPPPVILMRRPCERVPDAWEERCRESLEKPISPRRLLAVIARTLGVGSPMRQDRPKPSLFAPAPVSLAVLVAEDTPANQKLAACLLRRRGHTVTVVDNGRDAVREFDEGDFDVVLMDVTMPVMDGYEATAAIRQRERNEGRHVPIIALTAHAAQGAQARCKSAGMDAFLPKPIDVAQLLELVEGLAKQTAAPTCPKSDPDDSLRRCGGDGWPADVPAIHARDVRENFSDVIDYGATLKRLGGDLSLFRRLIALFEEDAPGLIETIRECTRVGDAASLHRAAHSLKGLAANFGAREVVAHASQLEALGKSGRLDEAEGTLTELEGEIDRLEQALAPFRAASTGDVATPAN